VHFDRQRLTSSEKWPSSDLTSFRRSLWSWLTTTLPIPSHCRRVCPAGNGGAGRKVAEIGGYPATFHVRDFLNCVKSRSQPLANAEAACYAHIACHAANIAIFLGRQLNYDIKKHAFVGDEQANRLRSEALRGPWRV